MTARLGYLVVERFGPNSGAAWVKYLDWSKLGHLKEVVGLDSMLCAQVAHFDSDEDWTHASYPDSLGGAFDDWGYALSRVPDGLDRSGLQLLAVLREPAEGGVRPLDPEGFEFCGFDLIEEATCTSALSNCGGFDDVFRPIDLNERGLVSDLASARDVQQRLRAAHPEEAHASCALWAVWRRALPS